MSGYYNGWSLKERRAMLSLLREALRSGALTAASHCSICGYREGDDPVGRNRLEWHDERYDRVEPYPICRSCHLALHRRFERPKPWLRLLLAHGAPGDWFMMLSLDPATRYRPFEESYAGGLPSLLPDLPSSGR